MGIAKKEGIWTTKAAISTEASKTPDAPKGAGAPSTTKAAGATWL
jgi:hypothetical protein